jgi:hypothetical protein
MSSKVFSLVYTSKSVDPPDAALCREILDACRKNNVRDEITGFLTVRSEYFLQLLEGDEKRVRACYKRILADRRHANITLQGEAWADLRLMPDWHMAWLKEKAQTDDLLALFDLARAGKPFADTEQLYLLLKKFSKNAEVIG